MIKKILLTLLLLVPITTVKAEDTSSSTIYMYDMEQDVLLYEKEQLPFDEELLLRLMSCYVIAVNTHDFQKKVEIPDPKTLEVVDEITVEESIKRILTGDDFIQLVMVSYLTPIPKDFTVLMNDMASELHMQETAFENNHCTKTSNKDAMLLISNCVNIPIIKETFENEFVFVSEEDIHTSIIIKDIILYVFVNDDKINIDQEISQLSEVDKNNTMRLNQQEEKSLHTPITYVLSGLSVLVLFACYVVGRRSKYGL